jgi:hypothetical protein
MGIALVATGYWMNLDVPATPNAVVTCVIIFNAAFGYRLAHVLSVITLDLVLNSWGPLPWLYPPEVRPTYSLFLKALTLFA